MIDRLGGSLRKRSHQLASRNTRRHHTVVYEHTRTFGSLPLPSLSLLPATHGMLIAQALRKLRENVSFIL
jgi:hypothetical protein